MPSSDVVALVRRSGGVVARKQLRTRKLRAASDHAVAEGSLVVLARKWVALPVMYQPDRVRAILRAAKALAERRTAPAGRRTPRE